MIQGWEGDSTEMGESKSVEPGEVMTKRGA